MRSLGCCSREARKPGTRKAQRHAWPAIPPRVLCAPATFRQRSPNDAQSASIPSNGANRPQEIQDVRMSDLETFRAETRAWLEANYPHGLDQAALMDDDDDSIWGGRARRFKNKDAKLWLDRMAEKGWTAPTWPKEYGGGGLSPAEARVLAQELGAHQGAAGADVVRHLDAGPGAARIRQRRAEARISAQDRARRDPLVPGLFRAGRRLRPRQPADPLRGQGRPLADQRPEDLDLLRRPGRLVLLPGAHRHDEEARGHQLRADRHDDARRRDAADQADLRRVAVLRDLLHRREGPQGAIWSAS